MDELTRLQQELEKDEALLKKLEDKLRFEDNPRLIGKWKTDIEEIKQRIELRKQEIAAKKKKSIQNQTGIIPELSNIPTTGFKASEVGANYTPLASMLSKRDFEAADKETARIMLWVASREKEGFLRKEDIEKFPYHDLRTIDQLWLASSNGKFGFSAQKQIWIECGKNVDKFYKKLGWTGAMGMKLWPELSWDLRGKKGHLPFYCYHMWYIIQKNGLLIYITLAILFALLVVGIIVGIIFSYLYETFESFITILKYFSQNYSFLFVIPFIPLYGYIRGWWTSLVRSWWRLVLEAVITMMECT